MFDGNAFLNQFDSECDKIHAEIEKQRPKDMLYKYTTYEGLENILATRKLRYTDYRFFNDPTEISFGKNLIKDTLLDAEIPSANKELFLKIINRIFDNFDYLYQMYVGCFSTSIKKLALWRYYACNGTGFAIGFNESFQKISPPAESNLGKAVICKVIYGEKEAKEIINKFIDQYKAILDSAKRSCQQGDKNSFIDFLKNLDSRLACHLITFLPGFKDESFNDEDEIRMFYTEGEGMLDRSTGKSFYFDDSLRDFIPINNQNYPFVKNIQGNKPILLPDEFSKEDISEIWIGPCCDFIEARTAIRKILINNKYDLDKIQVMQINLPYQNI